YEHHVDALGETQSRGRTEVDGAAREIAASPDNGAAAQCDDLSRHRELAAIHTGLGAVEGRGKALADAARMRLACERRVVVNAEGCVRDAGTEERLEDRRGIAARPAARIVGDIGEQQGR